MIAGQLCDVGTSATPLTHFLRVVYCKIEMLVADVTSVGSPGRAERAIFGVISAGRVFGQSMSFLWSGSHFVMKEPPLEL